MAIRAVLFDLDGTLWNLMPNVENWEPIAAMQAVALQPHFDRLGIATDPTAFVDRFWPELTAAQTPPSTDHREPRWFPVLRRTLAGFGLSCDEGEAENFFDALLSVPLRYVGVAAFQDAAPALRAVHAHGFKLGVITNNPKPARILAREIRDQGLPDVFETIVSSYDLGFRKPHPLIFETALEALGVKASEAIYVGDSYENDVVPALEMGMTAVFRRNGRTMERGLEHHIDELGELLPLLLGN